MTTMLGFLPFLIALLVQQPSSPPTLPLPAWPNDLSTMSPDHRRLALDTIDQGVWVMDVATGEIDLRIPRRKSPTKCIAWSADATKLALHGRNGTLEVFDAATARVLAKIETCQGQVAFAGAGSVLLIALGTQPAKLWPLEGAERIAALSVRPDKHSTAMAISRDGELVALGDEDSGVAVWKARTGQRIAEWLDVPRREWEKSIHALDFDPSGTVLAIGGGDCKVRLWRFGTKQEPRVLSHCDEDLFGELVIGCVRFSQDGRLLLSTSYSYWEGRVWDVETGKLVDHLDYRTGNPCPMPAWFDSKAERITLSLNLKTLRIGDPDATRSAPPGEGWTWWQSDGDLAWAVVEGEFQMRRTADGTVVRRIPARRER